MKITQVSAHVMGVGGATPSMPSRNWVFVRVQTDEGLCGLGEATTEWQETAVAALVEQHFGPLLIGQDPTRIQFIWQQLARGGHWRQGVVETSAISGIDQALWDITGKAFGQPVYKLLGGAVRDHVRLYARSDLGLPTHAEEARAAMDEGFSGFKIGPGDITVPFDEDSQIERGVALAAAIRSAAGPQCDLLVDCASLFSPGGAHRLIEGLAAARPLFVEEPVDTENLDAMSLLRASFPSIPIAAGERSVTRWGFRAWLEKHAVDVIQADICHCGGITELMRIAVCADVYGVTMAPHNPYGPVATAANVHACIAMPNFLTLEHCRLRPWFDKVQTAGPVIENGTAKPNDLPGLGVELDWDYVRAHSFRPLSRRVYFRKDGSVANP